MTARLQPRASQPCWPLVRPLGGLCGSVAGSACRARESARLPGSALRAARWPRAGTSCRLCASTGSAASAAVSAARCPSTCRRSSAQGLLLDFPTSCGPHCRARKPLAAPNNAARRPGDAHAPRRSGRPRTWASMWRRPEGRRRSDRASARPASAGRITVCIGCAVAASLLHWTLAVAWCSPGVTGRPKNQHTSAGLGCPAWALCEVPWCAKGCERCNRRARAHLSRAAPTPAGLPAVQRGQRAVPVEAAQRGLRAAAMDIPEAELQDLYTWVRLALFWLRWSELPQPSAARTRRWTRFRSVGPSATSRATSATAVRSGAVAAVRTHCHARRTLRARGERADQPRGHTREHAEGLATTLLRRKGGLLACAALRRVHAMSERGAHSTEQPSTSPPACGCALSSQVQSLAARQLAAGAARPNTCCLGSLAVVGLGACMASHTCCHWR